MWWFFEPPIRHCIKEDVIRLAASKAREEILSSGVLKISQSVDAFFLLARLKVCERPRGTQRAPVGGGTRVSRSRKPLAGSCFFQQKDVTYPAGRSQAAFRTCRGKR